MLETKKNGSIIYRTNKSQNYHSLRIIILGYFETFVTASFYYFSNYMKPASLTTSAALSALASLIITIGPEQPIPDSA